MQLTNDQGELTWGNLVEVFRNYEDYTSMSLPQYTKRCMVHSRTFIQAEVFENDIIPDIMRTTMNMYTGFIITAFDMAKYAIGSKTVRDMMGTVATEAIHEYVTDRIMQELFPSTMVSIEPTGTTIDDKPWGGREPGKTPNPNGSKVVDHNLANTPIPSGKIIQVAFGDPKGKYGDKNSGAFTINMYLQMHPTVVPQDVAEAFVDVNFTPSFKQRWLQMTTGEVSFWKDFVLSHDLVKRRRNAMRHDKSGALTDMLKRQQSAVTDAWLKLALIFNEKQNIANTVLIFDKQSFDRACVRNGLNFNQFNSRQRFFNKTFSMMVIVVDQNYNKVDYYFHGLDIKAQYDFKQLKVAGKADKYDLNDIMKSMSQGMAPRF